MEKVKIALVGVGNRGWYAHLPIITRMTDALDFVAICDLDAKRAQEIGESVGVPYYFNLEEMLAKAKPDIADICTPGETHHLVAKTVAEHGVSILCETPIAITLPCADFMISAAQKNGVKLEVSENVWRFATERLKAEIIRSGIISKVVRTYNHRIWGAYHSMNALRTYAAFREAKSVWALKTQNSLDHPITDGRPMTTETFVHAVITFEDDILAFYEQLSPRNSPLRRKPHTEVEGTGGSIVDTDVHLVDKKLSLKRITNDAGALERMALETDPAVVWENPFAQYGFSGDDQIAVATGLWSIRKAVLEDAEPEYGSTNARKDQEIAMAIGESSLISKKVELPLKSVTTYEQNIHANYERQYGRSPLED
ncbi:Gfo/Idh/MocA family oxidoreductase [Candidatus Poribacteria bacterium]|nr:Gfo/Idh/MocA family oxidoreductase [Candidatus Poribacteria bacterium]